MKGFAHPEYADSFAEFGTPRELPCCGGWIIERPIFGSPHRDAMGCYPLFMCRDWSRLPADLETVKNGLVALSMVTDPFGNYDVELLRACFDVVIPFKEHFVADLGKPVNKVVSAHHRYYARKALRDINIDICCEPVRFVDEWTDLYGTLARRFNVGGIRAFSKIAFAKQLNVPGAVMFRALHQGVAVAAHLVYVQDQACYGHLAAINSVGQDLMASYALYWAEIEYFIGKAPWFDWGAGAGVRNDGNDGLAQFKRGWSSDARTSYFCGRIFNRELYEDIAGAAGVTSTDYFPAYRQGEFG